MKFPGLVLAYHGCDRAVGEKILAGNEHISLSTNDYDWLGSGAYFWENSPQRALDWAKFLHNHPPYARQAVTEPFAVGAIIDPGNCLDLTVARGLTLVRKAYEEMEASFRNLGLPLPDNTPGFRNDEDLVRRDLDCAVCEFLHDMRKATAQQPFDTLKAAFFEGGPLYPGAGFAARTHIQWYVRDPVRSIRGYFRPSPGLDDDLATT